VKTHQKYEKEIKKKVDKKIEENQEKYFKVKNHKKEVRDELE
jgi:hypothetical protein